MSDFGTAGRNPNCAVGDHGWRYGDCPCGARSPDKPSPSGGCGSTCEWDHVTKANPFGEPCGRPAKVQVNGPNGYAVCGIHARSAWRIGDVEQEAIS